ncbi:NeuD/PglB/VioB family sugar acetyltransferase [bacterium]|nr:NeuD/PglB/VioB family sugar acetyltransferase [bacterium]
MNSKKKIVIIGAGGFGREVFHLLDNNIYKCVGFIDQESCVANMYAPIIGHESNMEQIVAEFKFTHCVIAIGDIKKREKVLNVISEFQFNFPLVNSAINADYSPDIGEGSIIYPKVVIMNDCKIGKFTLLNSAVTLGHDVVLGNYCNINPGANLAGGITVGDNTLIGIGATIKENVTIGKNVIIGAGSVVLNDIPDDTVAYGVPARPAE